MPISLQLLAVAIGGAAGSVARFAVSKVAVSQLSTAVPAGTLIVNIVGSLILGGLIGLTMGRLHVPPAITLLVGVGFCGAFTTFSTFAVETVVSRSLVVGLLNVALNNVLSVAMAMVGLYAATRV